MSSALATLLKHNSETMPLFKPPNFYILYGPGYTHTHSTALCPGLLGWAATRKVKTNLDFTEARDSEWQWHQLGHMQGCTSLQADNHASTPSLSFLEAGCPSCHPTNSVKALKAFMGLDEVHNSYTCATASGVTFSDGLQQKTLHAPFIS